jgi:hypothetical protein
MYIGNSEILELVIGGGLKTAPHVRSGGYRLDFVKQEGLKKCIVDECKYIMDGDNGDGTRYAVYQWRQNGKDLPYYEFRVHIFNPRKGIIKRGEVMHDFSPNHFLHIHIKIDGYKPANTKYLEYLKYIDPKIHVRTNYGSNAYTGLNTGGHIPGTGDNIINNTNEMVTLQKNIRCVSLNTVVMNVRKEPNTTAGVLATLQPKTQFETNIVSRGQVVKQNNRSTDVWYGIQGGFISGCWTDELPCPEADTTELQKQIDELKRLVEEMQNTINSLNADIVNKNTKIENQASELTKLKRRLEVVSQDTTMLDKMGSSMRDLYNIIISVFNRNK